MQAIVNAVMQSRTEKELKDLLKKLKTQDKVLTKNQGQIDQVVNMLDARDHCLGLSYVLAFKAGLEFTDHNLFVQQAQRLISQGNPHHIAIAPVYFARVCRQMASSLIMADRPMAGLAAALTAVRKLQGANRNLLTPAHRDYVLLAVKSKCYADAVQLVEEPIFAVMGKSAGLNSLDYLSYCYYGGIAYVALKQFDKALTFFQMALTAPSKSLSIVQIQAYKKYLLCSLLVQGEVVDLPSKITSPAVQRSVVRACQQYTLLGHAFRGGLEELNKVIEEHKDEFKRDNNLGLVKQTATALVNRKIQRLTSTYLTVSLQEIAEAADLKSPEEAEGHVLRMIETGEIYASISQADGVVSFHDDPEQYDNARMVAQMDTHIRTALDLKKRLVEVERGLEVDPHYLRKVMPREDILASLGGSEDDDMARALKRSMHDS